VESSVAVVKIEMYTPIDLSEAVAIMTFAASIDAEAEVETGLGRIVVNLTSAEFAAAVSE
jgi:hypothetical protein